MNVLPHELHREEFITEAKTLKYVKKCSSTLYFLNKARNTFLVMVSYDCSYSTLLLAEWWSVLRIYDS